MSPQRARNLIPPVFAVVLLAGFLISPTAAIVVLIVGGPLSGLLWSAISGRRRPRTPDDDGTRDERAAARAQRRTDRR